MEEGKYTDPHLTWMIGELEKVRFGLCGSILVSEKYPKDLEGNLAYRREVLRHSSLDPSYREKVKELFFQDPIFAFNTFFYTLDVRKRPFHNQPFCTYPYQDILIQIIAYCIQNKIDLPIEKSRDMGLSWILILTMQWLWLNPSGGADFLLGSRIEDYVDKKGDMRTLLEKARYNIYKLPKWLRPKGFIKNKHDHFMRLLNPETGSSITGESNNANFSTGGRYAAILFDEFAKWEGTDKSAWTAGGDATPCRIPNSTPFGASGQHYDLVTTNKNTIAIHWTLHPEKSEGAYCFLPKEDDLVTPEEGRTRSHWYDRECERRTAEEIAQELDIDYIGAGALVFGGSAGARVKQLLKSNKVPISYFKPDFQTMKLVPSLEPRDDEWYLSLYEEVDPTTCYSVGVDVVEGLEDGDFASVKVCNRRSGNLAGTYYARVDEVLLSKVVEMVSHFFSFERERRGRKEKIYPWIGIETNGPGLATFDLCAISGVQNLFMMPKYDAVTDTHSVSKGWKTTSVSRNVLITGIRQWLQEAEGFVDRRTAKEFSTFVRSKTGKAQAKEGAHDDEVMAWGIALQISNEVPLDMEFSKKEIREDGLPIEIFGPFRSEVLPSLEERCIASLEEKRNQLLEAGGVY